MSESLMTLIEKRRTVEAILWQHELDPRVVVKETFSFWLKSDKTAPQIAAILLGKSSEYDLDEPPGYS